MKLLALFTKSLAVLVLALLVVGLLYWLLAASRWDWVAKYLPQLLKGLWLTLLLWVLSCVLGLILAVPIGLLQVTGPRWVGAIARGYCTVIRGTPLLLQLWLIYYGLGSLFPQIAMVYPEFRQDFLWLIRLDAFWYALLAFTLSFAAYEGEIMRGAFLGVPRGELEAARAFGMTPWKVLTRVWLPRAVRMVLPALAGEVILQLKATPLAMTVTVMDLAGVVRNRITQDTYIVYEPLVLLAVIYMLLTFLTVWAFARLDKKVPRRR